LILQCTRIAAVKVEEISDLINTTIKQHSSKKRKGGESDTILGLPETIQLKSDSSQSRATPPSLVSIKEKVPLSSASELFMQDLADWKSSDVTSSEQVQNSGSMTKSATTVVDMDVETKKKNDEKNVKASTLKSTNTTTAPTSSSSSSDTTDLSIAVKKKASKQSNK